MKKLFYIIIAILNTAACIIAAIVLLPIILAGNLLSYLILRYLSYTKKLILIADKDEINK